MIRQKGENMTTFDEFVTRKKSAKENPMKQGDLKKGDRIEIFGVIFRGGASYGKGTVLDANHYPDSQTKEGEPLGWYIEFETDKNGYCYWKQGPDGGFVRRIK